MVWVKFHDKLCSGSKRGLPRAARFVFMELCLHSRQGRGVLAMPVGMSDLDGLHDVLGGDRKELASALKLLTATPKPSPGDPEPRAMIELSGEEGARCLTIPSWGEWNSGHETPGSSTERSRKFRQRAAATSGNETEQAPRNALATATQRPLLADATATQRAGNGDATQYRGEERREEERREEQTPLPPQAGSVGSLDELPETDQTAGPPSAASGSSELPTPETPSAPRRGRRKGAQAMLPGFVAEPADDVFAAYVDAWKRKVGGGAVPLLSEDRRKLVRARLAEGHVLATLKDAAAGIFLSEWHYMNRKDGRCSFDLALRDTENVERFAGLSEAAKPKPKRPEWLDEGTQMSPRMKAAWKEQLRTGIKPDTSGFSLETFLEGNGVDHMLEGLE